MPGFGREFSASSAGWPDDGEMGATAGIVNPGGTDTMPAPGTPPPAEVLTAGAGELAANTLPMLQKTNNRNR